MLLIPPEESGGCVPQKRHWSVDKNSGLTSSSDLTCTLRQRVPLRKSLLFSKKLENPIAAIWNFVHHYNATRRCKSGLVSLSSQLALQSATKQ